MSLVYGYGYGSLYKPKTVVIPSYSSGYFLLGFLLARYNLSQ